MNHTNFMALRQVQFNILSGVASMDWVLVRLAKAAYIMGIGFDTGTMRVLLATYGIGIKVPITIQLVDFFFFEYLVSQGQNLPFSYEKIGAVFAK